MGGPDFHAVGYEIVGKARLLQRKAGHRCRSRQGHKEEKAGTPHPSLYPPLLWESYPAEALPAGNTESPAEGISTPPSRVGHVIQEAVSGSCSPRPEGGKRPLAGRVVTTEGRLLCLKVQLPICQGLAQGHVQLQS